MPTVTDYDVIGDVFVKMMFVTDMIRVNYDSVATFKLSFNLTNTWYGCKRWSWAIFETESETLIT